MAQLTGNTVASTYTSLIKTADNTTINASTTEALSDGAGNPLPLKVSQTTIEFTGNVVGISTSDLTNDSGFITITDVNTATSSLSASLAADIPYYTGDLINNSDFVNSTYVLNQTASLSASLAADIASNTADIATNAGDILGLDNQIGFLTTSASLALVTASVSSNVITFEKGNGDTFNITVDTGSGGGTAGVTSLNSLGGALTIAGGTGISVTDNGSNTITITNTGGGGTTDTGSLLADASSDFSQITFTRGDGSTFDIDTTPNQLVGSVKNISGGTLLKGTPVHVTASASPPSGFLSEVVAADASDANLMPCHYILAQDLNDGEEGFGILAGKIQGVDTQTPGFSEGDTIYVAAGGGYTNTKPQGTNLIQNIGVVTKIDTTNGGGEVFGAGRTNDLPNLPQNFVWKGNANGVPQAVNQSTLSVGSAVSATTAGSATTAINATNATNATNLRIDAVTSGTYRIIVGDTGLSSGTIQRLKSNVADGFTYNIAGGIVSAGAFTATNNITAGGGVSGSSLEIVNNAEIGGTLTLGGIGNVEGEINQNTSDIADLQADFFSNVVTITGSNLVIDDANIDTYKGKTILCDNATSFDFEIDTTTTPSEDLEFYLVQFNTAQPSIINYAGNIYSSVGTSPTTRAQYSSCVVKHIGSDNYLVMGDIE